MKLETKYFKYLDFLRMVSILIVLFSHWIKECGILLLKPLGEYGVYGVNLFFVISGFLITRNLIISSYSNSLKKVLLYFFKNRMLRLFPAYYLLLIFLFLSQYLFHFWVVYDYSHYLWFIAYIPNFFFYYNGWPYPSINHMWSLAVEEQFYLFWPFVIYIFKKYLTPVFLVFIAFGFYFITLFYDMDTAKLFPMGNFSYLAGGAILAIYEPRLNIKISLLGIVLGCLVLLFIPLHFIIFDLIIAIVFVLLVNIFCKDFKPYFAQIFGYQPLLYIGKISYGIYLYHRFVPHFIYSIIHKLNLKINDQIIFISLFIITFIISHLSYKYFESYFLKLKKQIQ